MSIFNKKPIQLILSGLSVIILGLAVEHIYSTYGPDNTAQVVTENSQSTSVDKIPQVENQMLKEIESMVNSINSNIEGTSDTLPLCDSLNSSNSQDIKCKGKYSNDVISYVGEMLNMLADGQGMMVYKSGLRNIGEFKEGFENGKSIEKDEKGRVLYIGEKENGMRHGKGTYYLPDTFPAQSYIGQFKDDMIHGYGKYDYGDRIYEGEFFDGLRHGQGTETFNDGLRIYTGSWVYDQKEGAGKQMYTGDTYEGNFKGGVYDGYGIYTYSSGEKVTGYFKLGFRHGQSMYRYSSGDTEECDNYYYDLKNGDCIYRWSNGDYVKSAYVKGMQNGPSVEQSHGDMIKSNYKDNVMHGESIRKYTNGDVRVTNYEMGVVHGLEIYTFTNGEKHEMNYTEGKQDGITRIYYTSGDIQECKFAMGKPLGCEFKE